MIATQFTQKYPDGLVIYCKRCDSDSTRVGQLDFFLEEAAWICKHCQEHCEHDWPWDWNCPECRGVEFP